MADRYQDRPFPADGFGRGGEAAQTESDPLAELARLIGQNDPFGQSNRNVPSGPPRTNAPRLSTPLPPLEPVVEPDPPPGPPAWMQRANRQEVPRAQQREEPVSRDPFARDSYPDLTREPQRPAAGFGAGYQDPHLATRDFPEHDFDRQDFARPSTARPEPSAHAHPRDQFAEDLAKLNFGVADSHRGSGAESGYHREPSFEEAEPDPSRYDEALFGPISTGTADYQPEQEFHEDQYAYQDGYDEGDEEEPKRRSGMTTVFAILALGVLGTGGAFAYKTYFSSAGRSGEPPIIKADNSPTKVMAQPADAAPKVPDRLIGDGGEKLVSREETPVDVNSRSVGPRVVFPQLNQNANPPPPSASGTPGAAAANTGILPNSDPRPISTLRINGNAAGPTTADASGSPAPVSAAAPATKPAAGAKPVAGTRNSPANANASVSNTPLSLNPQSAAPAPAPAPSRVAAVAPTESAPTAAKSGGYLVSISSQVSEEEALSSYKVTQSKYSSVLGSYSPVIKRVDLPDKSVRYRAAVGPFATREEANQMCGTLKTAGGQCFAFSNQ